MVIFFDFDRTLFETDRLYTYLEKYKSVPGDPDSLTPVSVQEFVYEGVHALLKDLKENHTLVLVTLARAVKHKKIGIFQKLKVERSGIAGYFDKIKIHTGTLKEAVITALVDEYPEGTVVFIDDDPAELQAAKERNPSLVLVQMRHPGTKHEHAPDIEGAYQARSFDNIRSFFAQST